MTQVALTKEQEIDAAYAQMKAQEQKDKNAAWERAEAEQNKGKDL
jgi:hypothetical protein